MKNTNKRSSFFFMCEHLQIHKRDPTLLDHSIPLKHSGLLFNPSLSSEANGSFLNLEDSQHASQLSEYQLLDTGIDFNPMDSPTAEDECKKWQDELGDCFPDSLGWEIEESSTVSSTTFSQRVCSNYLLPNPSFLKLDQSKEDIEAARIIESLKYNQEMRKPHKKRRMLISTTLFDDNTLLPPTFHSLFPFSTK